MLLISADDFDDGELEEIILKRCSEFGSVKEIEIRRISDPYAYDWAIVAMSSADEAREVGREVGGAEYGSSVFIRIQHEGKLIPPPETLH